MSVLHKPYPQNPYLAHGITTRMDARFWSQHAHNESSDLLKSKTEQRKGHQSDIMITLTRKSTAYDSSITRTQHITLASNETEKLTLPESKVLGEHFL